jgi:4-hydroxybenzoyl-CoA reductase subunit beta
MMRLPLFKFMAPKTAHEAATILADHAPGEAMVMAGGTDLLPNMKRRQQTPKIVVSLAHVDELRRAANGSGMVIGAGLTLTAVGSDARIREHYTGLYQAASQVATPLLRNMGTLGGNLCLDTRCNYYDQNYEWRQAIGFCMKKEGTTCWVAPSSDRCLAVSSTDTAPMLLALGANVTLLSKTGGPRELALSDLYQNDGINYMTRRHDEVLTHVLLPPAAGWKSVYWKLRRRGSFDFPVLSVAAAVKLGKKNVIEDARHRRRRRRRLHRRQTHGQHRLRPPLAQARRPRVRHLRPSRAPRRRHARDAAEARAAGSGLGRLTRSDRTSPRHPNTGARYRCITTTILSIRHAIRRRENEMRAAERIRVLNISACSRTRTNDQVPYISSSADLK